MVGCLSPETARGERVSRPSAPKLGVRVRGFRLPCNSSAGLRLACRVVTLVRWHLLLRLDGTVVSVPTSLNFPAFGGRKRYPSESHQVRAAGERMQADGLRRQPSRRRHRSPNKRPAASEVPSTSRNQCHKSRIHSPGLKRRNQTLCGRRGCSSIVTSPTSTSTPAVAKLDRSATTA